MTHLVGRSPQDTGSGTVRQTVTVTCSAREVAEFWCDPDRVSEVLGDAGTVRFTAPNRYDWLLKTAGDDLLWRSELFREVDRLRFADAEGNDATVSYRPAPNRPGVEMTLLIRLPMPALIVGAAAFTVLYRARALMQTGEVPTIALNPAARHPIARH